MLLQTNSYIVPKDKRTEHARLIKRFKQVMNRLGCDDFEVYEQAGPNWSTEVGGRFVQIMRFRDRDHQKAIRAAEQSDAVAQELVREFCELMNFGYQHQQGLATTAYYMGMAAGDQKRLPVASMSRSGDEADASEPPLAAKLNGVHEDEALDAPASRNEVE
jgi:hypothetical protein